MLYNVEGFLTLKQKGCESRSMSASVTYVWHFPSLLLTSSHTPESPEPTGFCSISRCQQYGHSGGNDDTSKVPDMLLLLAMMMMMMRRGRRRIEIPNVLFI